MSNKETVNNNNTANARINRIKLDHPNFDYREFHTSEKLTQQTLNTYGPINIDEQLIRNSDKSEFGETKSVRAMINAIFELQGITSIRVHQWSVIVWVARAFDWDKDGIQDKVIAIIKKTIFEESANGVAVVPYRG